MTNMYTKEDSLMPLQAMPNTYQDPESVEIMRECMENRRHLGAATIAKAAEHQGARVKWFTRLDAWAVFDDRRIAINGNACTESALATGIALDKNLAKELMAEAGIPVPAGRRVVSADDAVQAQREIGRPVVIKPASGVMGRGVTVNATAPGDIREGYSRAAKGGAIVLVEQFIDGESEYRAHASSDECVGVFRRLLPSVTGDGKSTVAELIHEKNKVRRLNPATRSGLIPVDDVAERFLRRSGFSWDSVLPDGQHVVVRNINGITSGGDSEECLDSASESLKSAAVSAVRAIPGMDWGGVDVIVERSSGEPYVLEINTNAAFNGSAFPVFGTPRDLGGVIWRNMYNRSTPESASSPQSPMLLDSPEPVTRSSSGDAVSVRTLVREELQRRGHRLASFNRDLWSAQSPEGPVRWFNSVVGRNDLRIPVEVIRRPLVVRRIMRTRELRVPVGQNIGSVEKLRSFRDAVGTAITLVPYRMSPYNPAPQFIGIDEHIDDSILGKRRTWLAQTRPDGDRFSVIATPDDVLAILASPGQVRPASPVLAEISRLGVSAVRAVPQLRWAVVHIVYPFPKQDDSRKRNAMVEMLTINPTFSAESEVIVGSMSSVFNTLIH